jgi:hypothetical protein
MSQDHGIETYGLVWAAERSPHLHREAPYVALGRSRYWPASQANTGKRSPIDCLAPVETKSGSNGSCATLGRAGQVRSKTAGNSISPFTRTCDGLRDGLRPLGDEYWEAHLWIRSDPTDALHSRQDMVTGSHYSIVQARSGGHGGWV